MKVNYDFFKYVVDTTITSKTASYSELYKDSVKQAAMQDPEAPLRLPFRSNSKTGPDGSDQGGPNQNAVLGYQAVKCEEHNESGPGEPGVNPCLMGAVHTKAAWIPLYDEEEYANYYTKRALYYVTKDGKTQCEEGVFGLVGFHIIQRVHQSAGEKGVGGTFIFASWEHKEVAEGGYYFVNYWDGRPLDAPGSAGFYPNPAAEDGPLPVTRQVNTVLKNTDEVNEAVWEEIRKINPQSPWLNYRLIGTQFLPVDLNAPAMAPESGTPYPVSENDPLGTEVHPIQYFRKVHEGRLQPGLRHPGERRIDPVDQEEGLQHGRMYGLPWGLRAEGHDVQFRASGRPGRGRRRYGEGVHGTASPERALTRSLVRPDQAESRL